MQSPVENSFEIDISHLEAGSGIPGLRQSRFL